MELPQLIILAVLLLTAVILAAKVYFLHRSAEEIATRSFQFPPGTRICGGLLRISISSSVCSAKSAGAVSRGTWN